MQLRASAGSQRTMALPPPVNGDAGSDAGGTWYWHRNRRPGETAGSGLIDSDSCQLPWLHCRPPSTPWSRTEPCASAVSAWPLTTQTKGQGRISEPGLARVLHRYDTKQEHSAPPTIRLATNTVVIAIQMLAIARITPAYRRRTRRTGFIAVPEYPTTAPPSSGSRCKSQ